ncbi:MAG: TIGR02099 family protein [Nevskiaceae bacterium]|nr:MAG: TIGR02099 family protein [Nevskiaceae bacterium]TAM25232.1 MAG: TIGR02099 family protein [Nevskiaceae bacterium]
MERRKRRWWTRGITWLSALVVLAATLSGLFQLAVLAAPGYRDDLAARVSTAVGRPVRIGGMELAWRWLWPQLQLSGVELVGDDGRSTALVVERLRLGFAAVDLLHGRLVPARIELSGVRLELDLGADDRLRLRGIAPGAEPPDLRKLLRELRRFDRLRALRVQALVHDARLPGRPLPLQLSQADLRIDSGASEGFELRLEAEAGELIAQRLKLRAGFTGAFDQPEHWRGRWTIEAGGLRPGASLLARLPVTLPLGLEGAELSAAGDWAEAAPAASSIDLKAGRVLLNGAQPLSWKDFSIRLAYQPQAGGGSLEWSGLSLNGARGAWPLKATGRLGWRHEAGQWRLDGSADFLRLDDLAPWLSRLPKLAPEAAARLASLRGDARELSGRYEPQNEAAPRYALAASLVGLGYGGDEDNGFSGLAGRLSADETGGRFELRGEQARLRLPKAFGMPLAFERLSANLSWNHESEGWRLQAPDLAWGLLGSQGEAELDLRLPPGESPLLKLEARLKAADAARLKPLMPLRWGTHLRDWLQRAVVRARVPEGLLRIDGPLADFPFHSRPTGSWSLDLAVADARLDYQPDWPGADRVRAQLKFAGNGLSFEAERGLISGIEVLGASGGIEDFSTGSLRIEGRTRGEAGTYFSFLRGSPLATRLAGLVGHTEAEGLAEADVQLDIPLHSNLGQKLAVAGQVRLPGNVLHITGLEEPVRDIQGGLRFSTKGVAAEQIVASYYGAPVQAQISANAEGNDELQARMPVDFDTEHGVAARFVPRWVRERLDGLTEAELRLPLSGPRAGRIRITTDLRGAGSRLPVPLAKLPEQVLPLVVEVSGDERVPLALKLDLPARMALALRFARERGELVARGIGVRLGGGEVSAPEQDGMVISGRADRLDLAAWIGLLGAGSGEELPFHGAEISVAHLQAAGYELPEAQLKASRAANGNWRVLLDGASGAGSLDWLRNGNGDLGRLNGRFQRLNLVPMPAAAKLEETPPTPADAPSSVIDPNRVPTLDFAVDRLNIGGEDFGRLQLQSERLAGGQRLKQIRLEGGVASLSGEGEWKRQQNASSARASFELGSSDVAAALRGLGFAPTLSGRSARFRSQLVWAPGPRGLEWSQAQGQVGLEARDGALRTVEPGGTSRVLGLLNFYALPKRLTLNFRDVLSKGLNYDRIDGQFELAGGNARTQNLVVRSPSLRVEVRGRIGLSAHDYDQQVTIYPDVSGVTLGALLLGGASLAAGPAMPLLALIANQVLDKPLGEATQIDYRLTGSWDNPEIRKLDGSEINSEPRKPETPPAAAGKPGAP